MTEPLKRHFRAIDTAPACGVGPRYAVTEIPGSVTCERCRRSRSMPEAERAVIHRDAKPEKLPLFDWSLVTERAQVGALRRAAEQLSGNIGALARTLGDGPEASLAALEAAGRTMAEASIHIDALRETLRAELAGRA